MIVSDSQWKGAVEEECERYVAKHATLKYVSPKNVNEEVGKGRFVSEDKYERNNHFGEDGMVERIRRPKKFDEFLNELTNKDQGVFRTYKDALIFAACLGYKP